MHRLNRNERQRDHIIFGEHDTAVYMGGVRYFKNLSLEKLEQLIECDFVDLYERQNCAPSVKEIYEFMKKYPEYTKATRSRLCATITASAWRVYPKTKVPIRGRSLMILYWSRNCNRKG